ncbi:uncharacterized protein CTRU02_200925 [Colletotrichum truncatum]|uniref:Uncharacterized protein n=1 Tax=Colletotrichum truncatum TaxID=5467 RepID=A0ACC3ZG22_COLTU|nr:uncharacterized protein CTRU02_00692 [Colletotrichum truncatum]KAF6801943.1 hypothetical protein CTRU02_00692 [Colletotrichum truncatum]
MKSLALLKLVLLLPQLALADICNNNCGRQVAGTARQSPPFASRSSLCSAFVTANGVEAPQPEPSVNARGLRWNAFFRRQDAPEPVITGTKPAYASSCPDATAYWSACQCIDGITATTAAPSSQTTTEILSTITPEPSPTTTETSSTSSSTTDTLPVCTQGLEFAIYSIDPDSTLCTEALISTQSRTLNLQQLLEGRIPDGTGLTSGSSSISFSLSGEQASSPIEYNGVQGPAGSTSVCNIIAHRGYIEFTAPGEYSLLSNVPDDVILAWVGPVANSGEFRAGNSDVWGRCCDFEDSLIYNFTIPPFVGPSFHVAYRIFYGNAVGPGNFAIKVVHNADSPEEETEPSLVASCVGEELGAPEWLPWQDEVVLP